MSLVETLLPPNLATQPVISVNLPHNFLREVEIRRIMALQLVIKLTGGTLTPNETTREEVMAFASRVERYLASGA